MAGTEKQHTATQTTYEACESMVK